MWATRSTALCARVPGRDDCQRVSTLETWRISKHAPHTRPLQLHCHHLPLPKVDIILAYVCRWLILCQCFHYKILFAWIHNIILKIHSKLKLGIGKLRLRPFCDAKLPSATTTNIKLLRYWLLGYTHWIGGETIKIWGEKFWCYGTKTLKSESKVYTKLLNNFY